MGNVGIHGRDSDQVREDLRSRHLKLVGGVSCVGQQRECFLSVFKHFDTDSELGEEVVVVLVIDENLHLRDSVLEASVGTKERVEERVFAEVEI